MSESLCLGVCVGSGLGASPGPGLECGFAVGLSWGFRLRVHKTLMKMQTFFSAEAMFVPVPCCGVLIAAQHKNAGWLQPFVCSLYRCLNARLSVCSFASDQIVPVTCGLCVLSCVCVSFSACVCVRVCV